MTPTETKRKACSMGALACAAVISMTGCDGTDGATHADGILLDRTEMSELHDRISTAFTATPSKVMTGTGVAGAMGGARVKVLTRGRHEVLLPIVQLTASQVPIVYTIVTEPKNALIECRLQSRDGLNVVARLQLEGGRDDEIAIIWTSIVLMGRNGNTPPAEQWEPYLQATSCVQATAKNIKSLADELWQPGEKRSGYASSIQQFIGGMEQQGPPRSLDAVGILKSGGNRICTANANLAAALLRAKRIPARSLAVIPVISKRLEMHRTVEFLGENGQAVQFDPSSLHANIPVEAWQNIIVAKTTVEDETAAMKPRMGAMLGCPYGHELELLDRGLTLWGHDFFWTEAKPVSQFDITKDILDAAKVQWVSFLETGKLTPGQIAATAARDADGLRDGLSTE